MSEIELLQKEIAELRNALAIQTKTADIKVKQLYKRAIEEHWSGKRYVDSGWKRQVELIWDRHLKRTFGRKKLAEVTTRVVRNWHKKYEDEAPYAGNRALSVLSTLFDFAIQEELKPQNTNPCALVKPHPEKSRQRFATEEEIKKIDVLLQREAAKHPRSVAFIYLLMYTGARPSAIARATWDQLRVVEVKGERVGIIEYKGKRHEEKLVVPPQAMKLIDQFEERIIDKRIIGVKNPKHLWKKIVTEAGCPDLWSRDLRRTFATVGFSNGVTLAEVGKVLNHKSQQTTEIYAKVVDSVKINAALEIANQVEKMVKS